MYAESVDVVGLAFWGALLVSISISVLGVAVRVWQMLAAAAVISLLCSLVTLWSIGPMLLVLVIAQAAFAVAVRSWEARYG